MLSLLLIIISSIFFVGVIDRTRSRMTGRKGATILQPMKDIIRLFGKGSVYSKTTSFIFRLAPTVYLSTTIVAALLIPFGRHNGILSFNGDFILFAYVLGLGKFFNIISALDTGSSFEGMGASREALMSMVAEPSFFILMGSIGVLTGQTSFQQIFSSIYQVSLVSPFISFSLVVLGALIFFMLGLIENSRMPVDDPKTHLELTMIHEVMILDNSGFDLGLITYTGFLKFVIYGSLIANLFISVFNPIYLNIVIFLGVQFLYAVSIGLTESLIARFRINQNSQFIFSLSSLALLIYIGVMMLIGRFN